MLLPINSIERGIIREGSWVGSPAVIVTFQGCDVGCRFCESKETWDLEDSLQLEPADVVQKPEKATPVWAEMNVDDLFDRIRELQPTPGIVFITGGEPLAHDLSKLCRALTDGGYQVTIETSGVHEFNLPQPVWVAVCPKFRQPGGYTIQSSALQKADEIRMVVTHPQDIRDLELAMEWINPDVQEIYLQPRTGDPGAFELAVGVCLAKDWKLSVQLPLMLVE